MSTPVLATKLFAPTPRPHVVGRARLTASLTGALAPGTRVAVVSAPPGFGKTTLLSGWLRHLESVGGHRAGWISLDEGDNDVDRFLAHLVAALQRVHPDLDVTTDAPPEGVLTLLVNELARSAGGTSGGRSILVLDDYHVISAREVHEAVAFLVEHLPESQCVVIATRADPPLPLSRLRSRGELVEVRADDLRFTPAEARELLNRGMGLDLTAADVEALDERTEGWAAGLQLAALSLRGREGAAVSEFIAGFTGSNRFVIDYLADEVLSRQPARVRDFLLRTSVLQRLTAPLCDAVCGHPGGAAVLEQLERDNLFLVALDDRREWYRYHHLFGDVLQARLLADRPDDVPLLHLRASEWYAEQGLAEDAVRHAIAGEDFDRAARLVEEALPETRRARRDALLTTWITALPADVVRRNPVLSIVAAWSRLMAGDLDAVASRLDEAEAALAAGAADATLRGTWVETEDLRTAPATIEVYRASLAQARGDVTGTVAHAQRAVDLAGPDDHFVRGAGSGFLGLAAWAAGDVHRAIVTFGDAVRSLHAAGNLVDELDTTVVLARMWVSAGRPSRARRRYEDALRAADGAPRMRATPDLHVGLADLDRERGDLSGAEQHLETARLLAERGSITENRHMWPVVMAGVHTARGEHDEALRLLDQAQEVYRPGFYPDIRPISATRARVQIAAGDLESASAWADERGLGVTDEPDYLHEYDHLTLVRLLLARDGHGCGRDVLDLLERLHEAAAAVDRRGSILEIRMLQALAHHALGDRARALAALRDSVTATVEPASHVRVYLDEGTPMRELLGLAASAGEEPLAGHARRLVDGGVPQPRRPVSLPDPLSERERAVLRLLDSELTGPQIARELYVTLNTLRTHTKHIFTKLDVTTRAAAVRRGKEHGLL